MFSWFKPARMKAKEWQETKMVADFDRMVSCRVAFVLNGRTHYINPVETEKYLQFVVETEKLDEILKKARRGELKDKRSLYDQYGAIFNLMCDTLDASDVYEMTDVQIGAVVNLIRECVSGKAFVLSEDEKKKTNRSELESGSSSVKSVDSMAGMSITS